MTFEQFINKTLPKATNMEEAVNDLFQKADEGAKELAMIDPLRRNNLN